ncbi:hypothetical protein BJX63DRAFT_415131 [Aspergillus granulosus]|uniref:Uncharacterized protein n=1 Tax=Aspergillus granulosus TaxID=176169 RepID=A0ABR4GTJ8_9EURO
MDPLSILSSIIDIFHVISPKAQSFNFRHGDPWMGTCIKGQYLGILNLSFNLTTATVRVKRWCGETPLKDELTTLPAHGGPSSCQIYLAHGLETSTDFKAHIEMLTGEDFSDFANSTASTARSSLSRRLECDQMPWWYSNIYAMCTADDLEMYRLFRDGPLDGHIRSNMKIRFFWDKDGNMTCFILCNAVHATYRGLNNEALFPIEEELDLFVGALLDLDPTYAPIQAKAKDRVTQQRLVMLRVSHAILLGYIQFLLQIDVRISATNTDSTPSYARSSRSILTPSSLRNISADSEFWERIVSIISLFNSSIASFLDVLQIPDDSNDDLSKYVPFRELLIEIRTISQELEKRTESISRRLESQLKFLELRRNLQESSSLSLLSLLAVVYLPLALASSILSMSTRIADLKYILYDFVGITVVLFTITAAIAITLRFMTWVSMSLRHRVGWLRSPLTRLLGFMVAVPWVLVLASFLVGMAYDAGLGLKMLGYSAAGFSGLMVVFILAAIAFAVMRGLKPDV